ncbi:BLUF domain-containing protein [Dyella sp.]|uniref:BLUF domain-containing protein n=1 Tax=Dyella sp. TaxID=1869338 RepID=UPI003F7FC401
MSDIQQLVYASRATFQPTDNGGGVEPEVARILMQSRRNNPRRGLVGALYYGDGCFFQCLEGPPGEIDTLYQQLMKDPRHRDLTVLRRQFIGATSFAGWSMKYVPAATDVQTLLALHGKDRFDPYRFDDELLEAMVTLLHRRSDGDDLNPMPATTGARPGKPVSALQPAVRRRSLGTRLAWVALAVAAVAVVALLLR